MTTLVLLCRHIYSHYWDITVICHYLTNLFVFRIIWSRCPEYRKSKYRIFNQPKPASPKLVKTSPVSRRTLRSRHTLNNHPVETSDGIYDNRLELVVAEDEESTEGITNISVSDEVPSSKSLKEIFTSETNIQNYIYDLEESANNNVVTYDEDINNNKRIATEAETCQKSIFDKSITLKSTNRGKQLAQRKDSPKKSLSNTKEPMFACNICGKYLTGESELSDHLDTHIVEKVYTCDVCSKTFTYQSKLRRHMKVHSTKKLFTCKLCNKHYTDSISLQLHRSTHTANNFLV